MTLRLRAEPSALQTALERVTGVNLDACLQCGCCSGGCSAIECMAYSPRQIIQLIKLDRRDVLLSGDAVWYCASCHICEDRCPAGIDVAAVLDGLRAIAWREKPAARQAQRLFHAMFLAHIGAFGRLEEGLFAFLYSRRAGTPLPEAKLFWRLLLRGRVWPSLPRRAPAGFRNLWKKLRQEEAKRR